MRLTELEPHFLKIESTPGFRQIDDLSQSNGIRFLCPKCYSANNGPVGTHSVICWFADRGVPNDFRPGPGRWRPAGTGYEDLTFIGPDPTSVHLTGPGCGWHGFITNGEVTI